MKDKYNSHSELKNKKHSKLEKITSLALIGSIFILFNNYMLNEILHKYWT